jgi:hypothetical protein
MPSEETSFRFVFSSLPPFCPTSQKMTVSRGCNRHDLQFCHDHFDKRTSHPNDQEGDVSFESAAACTTKVFHGRIIGDVIMCIQMNAMILVGASGIRSRSIRSLGVVRIARARGMQTWFMTNVQSLLSKETTGIIWGISHYFLLEGLACFGLA